VAPTSVVPTPDQPVSPLDLPDLPRPASGTATAGSPVISIGTPADSLGTPADETATVQFARPVVVPVSKPVLEDKPDSLSKAEEDFFGPASVKPGDSAENAKAALGSGKEEPETDKITKSKDKPPRTKRFGKPTAKTAAAAEDKVGEAAEDKAGEAGGSGEAGEEKASDTSDKPQGNTKKRRKSRLPGPAQWAIEIAVWVVAALILSTLIRLFVVQLFVVPSGSMESTLEIGDRIAVLKYAQFQRGDIVVFSDPGGWLPGPAPTVSPVHEFFEKIGLLASTDQNYLVKRVIGLPGDRVQCCSNGHLTVNGVPIDESSYLKDPTQAASAFLFDVTVPAGRIFVLGDNRGDSADSRYHLCENDPQGLGMNAFVPIQNVVGPVRAVVLPFGRTGHRATPTSVFAKVPSAAGPPPSVAKVSVSAGGYNGPCGNG